MRVLVCGAGIAGPTLAWWLVRHGFDVTLVEHAPALRRSGYIVDFWGAGFDVAERMNLLPEIREKGYSVREVRLVDRNGKRAGGFAASVFDRYSAGRFTSVPRGELAATIFERLGTQVEVLFDDTVDGIEETGAQVHVRFRRSPARDFDLIVGADGLHSRVRELAFGPQQQFERYLGYQVAAFEASGYRPRDELVYVTYTQVGQQVGRFAMRGDRTMFLFIFADERPGSAPLDDLGAQKAELVRRFGDAGWECPQILAALEGTSSLYFDRVSQIHLPRWTHGRVALVGDAAFCVSLLAGQGSALAMVSSYVLAGELKAAGGDHTVAFARYHERLSKLIAGKQASARRFAGSFAPRTRFGLLFRNQVTKLLSVPVVADLAFGRGLKDELQLPDYSR